MTDQVLGDPASCSHAGGTLRQLATRLRVAGRGAHAAFEVHGGERPAAVEVAALRRYDAVDRATAALAVELDRIGTALQAHATDLAEAVAAARQVAARAEAACLRVVDGQVVPDWGVTGVADASATSARDTLRAALQSELDSLTSRLRQQRQRLANTASDAQGVMAAQAGALRR